MSPYTLTVVAEAGNPLEHTAGASISNIVAITVGALLCADLKSPSWSTLNKFTYSQCAVLIVEANNSDEQENLYW